MHLSDTLFTHTLWVGYNRNYCIWKSVCKFTQPSFYWDLHVIHRHIKICHMLFYILFNKISFHPFLNTVAENLIQLISNTRFTLLKLLPFGHSFIQNVIDISNESHLQVKDKFIWVPQKTCYLELSIVLLMESLGQRIEWKLRRLFYLMYRAFESSMPLCFIVSATVFVLLLLSNFF